MIISECKYRMNYLLAMIAVIIIATGNLGAQIENVPSVHPVYQFLKIQEAKGIVKHFSTSAIPMSKSRIISALVQIRQNIDFLSEQEILALRLFESEFQITNRQDAVVFYSKTDSTQLLFSKLLSDFEKHFYYYDDSTYRISIVPLANADLSLSSTDTAGGHALMGNLGLRVYGSLGAHFGFYLQTTNGTLFSGERWVALNDSKLRQNIKFAKLKSDFDFTESHIAVQYDWFRGEIGRQTRYLGSGLHQSVLLANTSPPMDGLDLSANFENFSYTFSLYSLLSVPDSSGIDVGFSTKIPSKLMSMHRFSLRPEWGEVSFWESVIYSERGLDLSYLNPFSFLKSLEHANRDRDNSLMGMDWTIRPINHLQINGSFLLDDIIFSEIGSGYWSNKWAYNLSFALSSKIGMIGIEYARVEPYMFTHFNYLNNYTNDQLMIGSYLYPNSDSWSFIYKGYLLGNRYPVLFRLGYERHGSNIYDENGALIKNVGSDPLQVRRPQDDYYLTFLDGSRDDAIITDIEFFYELIRGFNIGLRAFGRFSESGVTLKNINIRFSFQDF